MLVSLNHHLVEGLEEKETPLSSILRKTRHLVFASVPDQSSLRTFY